MLQKVYVSRSQSGGTKLTMQKSGDPMPVKGKQPPPFSKTTASQAGLIFPVTNMKAMPAAGKGESW
jgi:hypothetical protein